MPRKRVKVRRTRERNAIEEYTFEVEYNPDTITIEDIVEHYDSFGGLRRTWMNENNVVYIDDSSSEIDVQDYHDGGIEIEEEEDIPSPPERKIPWL